jgi:hypothetical protein
MQEDIDCDREFNINYDAGGTEQWVHSLKFAIMVTLMIKATCEIAFGNICAELKYRSIFILLF